MHLHTISLMRALNYYLVVLGCDSVKFHAQGKDQSLLLYCSLEMGVKACSNFIGFDVFAIFGHSKKKDFTSVQDVIVTLCSVNLTNHEQVDFPFKVLLRLKAFLVG